MLKKSCDYEKRNERQGMKQLLNKSHLLTYDDASILIRQKIYGFSLKQLITPFSVFFPDLTQHAISDTICLPPFAYSQGQDSTYGDSYIKPKLYSIPQYSNTSGLFIQAFWGP